MLFPYTSQNMVKRRLVFLSAALLTLLLLAMTKAEEGNNINFPPRETIGSGDNKEDGSPDCLAGFGVNFPGYYSFELLPVDLLLPETATGRTTTSTTTANPVDTDVVSTAAGRRSTSGYPVDWSAVADAYYRSIDGGSRKIPSPAESAS